MKNNKLQISLIIITFLSLLGLVAIQISWIVKAANIQEKQFNHSVNLAMHQIVEKLSEDMAICDQMSSCIGKGGTGSCFKVLDNQIEWNKVDSIVKYALNYYHINIAYEFDIVETSKDSDYNVCKKSYFSDNLEEILLRNGVELKIKFPKKSEFILAQIGSMFISSILLIIIISISFVLIFKYYRREKSLYRGTRDFINNITHEFKTPITNISLANSMISKHEKVLNDEKLNHYCEIIKTEHKKLRNRVEGLLEIARIENANNSICEKINICTFIENTVDSYLVQVQELNGEIKFENKAERCFIQADDQQFQILISNLIDNAIKYCNRKPKIIIRSYNKSESLFIEIEDNGIGISKDQLKQIFEKYYRVPTGDLHDVKGFGIGLSTVKAIIDSLKGEIDVQSKVGVGTKFIIKLPNCSEN